MRSRLRARASLAAIAALSVALGPVLVATPALAAEPALAATLPTIVINEVDSATDWIELTNTGAAAVDISGFVIRDDNDTRTLAVPAGTSLAPGAYYSIDTNVGADGFGLGKSDMARVFAADGATLIDSYAWTAQPATSYGRCPDGAGAFATTFATSRDAANVCAPPAQPGALVINEVESNGDDTDWVELFNNGATAIDISGYQFRDNDSNRVPYTLPAGSIVAPKGFFVIDQKSGSNPEGFDFGLGNPDEPRLFLPDGSTLVASYAYTDHATVTWGRCTDGTGELTNTTVSTKGAPNDCSTALSINEIESQPASGPDWIELVNVGVTDIDASGFVVRDSKDDSAYVIPAGTTIAAGAYFVIDTLGFGLGDADSVRLFAADGTTLIDSYSWTSHAPATFGRCPDPRGDMAQTTAATKGTQNLCAGVMLTEAWPGSPDVRALDAESTFSGDLSGIDYEPSGSAAPGTLWAVQNGDGLLYKIVSDGTGGWAPAAGWGAGKKLRYQDGTGTPDSEGVTIVADDSAGGIYVSSERNNEIGSVSRPAVLRFDASGTGAELIATQEWNLAADFPGLGSNSGLEGITWVPDAFLTGKGFVDEAKGTLYDPAAYTGHGSGLFFVGVEGTASVYAYALMPGGTFARIATIDSGFDIVADVQFDADRGALWVVCDDACQGRTAQFEVSASGDFTATRVFERPANTQNFANEGFAVAPDAVCRAGSKPTYYADDADTDGFSLREGSLPCATPGGPPTTPAPEPTLPATGGGSDPANPVGAVDDGQLTEAARGSVSALASAAAGQTVRVSVGTQYAGKTVWVSLHSTPISLGSYVVAADGSIAVTLPAGIAAGDHRLVVQDAAGNLIGWTPLNVTGALASTGADAGGTAATAGIAAALIAAGALGVLVRRRRVNA